MATLALCLAFCSVLPLIHRDFGIHTIFFNCTRRMSCPCDFEASSWDLPQTWNRLKLRRWGVVRKRVLDARMQVMWDQPNSHTSPSAPLVTLYNTMSRSNDPGHYFQTTYAIRSGTPSKPNANEQQLRARGDSAQGSQIQERQGQPVQAPLQDPRCHCRPARWQPNLRCRGRWQREAHQS